MVDPAGRVVGVDFSDAATLGGPFDLAFTRCFLMHRAARDRRGPGPSRPRRRPGGCRHKRFLHHHPRSELGFEIHAATLAAARDRAVALGIAAERIDDLLLNLRAAKSGQYEWVSTPFFLDLALRKPTMA
jgi:hypothetical protein